MTAKGKLVRLFAAKPPGPLDDLAVRSDAAMQVLFERALSGLLLIDPAGRIARANPALRAMLDPTVDLGEGAPAALIFAADDRVAAWQPIEALLLGRATDCRFTARLRPVSADPHHLADIACRLIDPDGATGGVLMRITDLSAQARLEAQLAEGRELQTVGRLAGGVAHDFNNLLTVILGAAELVQDRVADAQTAADLEQIRRGAERGAALARNLLALSRQQHLQATPLDVNSALRDFAALLRRALPETIALDLHLEEPGRRVRVDPGQLDQVLMNLAMNAGHAMADGGRLVLRSGHATLYRPFVQGRETIPPGRYVTITVQDTGIGIPAELLERIFEPFFTTRRAQGGTGLGLATAHGIIRQSGGFLTVETEPGRGTMFCLYLPRDDTASEPAEAPHPPSPPVAAGTTNLRRVLLVDDEHAVRRIAARGLARHGWEVLEADSAEAALALLDADPGIALTAMVSDVVMPGQDGPALVQAVRARYPGLPAILVSGYAEEHVLAGGAAQAITFLGKPYTPRTLLACLAEVAPVA